MTTEQKQVKEFMQLFGQDCPDKPTIPRANVLQLRAKLILEEALELIVEGLGIETITFKKSEPEELDLKSLLQTIKENSFNFTNGQEPNIIAIADGIADSNVVTLGTAVACGLDMEPLFNEVHRSNMSKLWNDEDDTHNPELTYTKVATHPEIDVSLYFAKDKDGKVIKSPSYSPANLQPLIELQQQQK